MATTFDTQRLLGTTIERPVAPGMELNDLRPKRFIVPLIAGAFARTTAAAILAPVDVLKTRIQFSGTFKGARRYDGVREAVRTIWQHEGARGFYRGLPTRVLYIMPAAAISFAFCTW